METSIVVPAGKQENIIEMSIIQRIHEIRGVRVMLDFDLAERYGIETRVLKQAVRRNLKRFEDDDFMFELTKNEVDVLSRSQFVTLNKGRGSNIKYMPFGSCNNIHRSAATKGIRQVFTIRYVRAITSLISLQPMKNENMKHLEN